jgi:2-polyprenyl-6-methoxyphenol hydroxylase-like FAD-dependent oxidoreductase
MDAHYDAIVIGGRCAGASTAMLLARGGLRVLVLEAARPGTDTLSTHALMRGGVLQLHRWGLLDAVVAAGTPAIVATEFGYGDEVETVEVRAGGGVSALRAPRRTVLDPILLDAAGAAGAEVCTGARVTRLLTDGRTVCGVEGVTRGVGTPFRARAPLVIGADGRRSTVAQAVDAPVRRHGTVAGGVIYGYYPGLARDRYR